VNPKWNCDSSRGADIQYDTISVCTVCIYWTDIYSVYKCTCTCSLIVIVYLLLTLLLNTFSSKLYEPLSVLKILLIKLKATLQCTKLSTKRNLICRFFIVNLICKILKFEPCSSLVYIFFHIFSNTLEVNIKQNLMPSKFIEVCLETIKQPMSQLTYKHNGKKEEGVACCMESC